MSLFDQSRFNLVLCEIHYTPIHGKTCNSFPTIEGHYILIYKFDGLTGIILDDELEEYYTDEEDDTDENPIVEPNPQSNTMQPNMPDMNFESAGQDNVGGFGLGQFEPK